MRFVILIGFGAFGAALMLLARAKYNEANVRESILLASFAGIALFLAAGALWINPSSAGAAASVGADSSRIALTAAIELRPRGADVLYYAIGVVLSIGLACAFVKYPDLVWGRWLAYPAAAIALVVAAVCANVARGQYATRVRADADGIEIRSSSNTRRVQWSNVSALKELTLTRTRYTSRKGTLSARTIVANRFLILYDSGGAELMRLDEDLRPVSDLQKLRRYIPYRTGLPVAEETTDWRN